MLRAKMTRGTLTLAGAAVVSLSGVARADMVSFNSTTDPFFHFGGTVASFTATWTYTGLTSTTGTLVLEIMNTTSETSPTGAMVAIAFNRAADTTLTTTPLTILGDGDNDAPWHAVDSTPPPGNIGTFDSVYTVDGAAYAGAGSGMEGIEVSDGLVTFSWDVDASGDGLTLSVLDFLNPALNSNGFGFAVKFNGVGSSPNDSDSLVLVPMPPAVWAGTIGLVGVVALRRRILLT